MDAIQIPPLNPTLLVMTLQVCASVAGAWIAVKAQLKTLENSQRESLRQIQALHKRLDGHSESIRKLDKQTAVIWDRLNRRTERFAAVNPTPLDSLVEQDMFKTTEGE